MNHPTVEEKGRSPHPCRISGAVITLNEEAKIGDCLDSLSFCDEVVVVDSGSSDATVKIAEEKGARVIHRPFVNYADQKNFANDQTRGEWIVCLDADERISKKLRQEIVATLDNPARDVYAMPRRVYYINRWINHSSWYPARKERLFRRGKGAWSLERVHERFVYEGAAAELQGDIYHLSFDRVADHLNTLNRFTDLSAQERLEEGGSAGWWAMATRPPFTFFKMYFLRLGFLDGAAGFIVASLSAYHVFCKYAKIAEGEGEGRGNKEDEVK